MNDKVKPITLTPVESSQIHSIGHCPDTNRLHICFKGKGGPGGMYEYAGFTADDFAKFQRAESLGKYFGDNIRKATNDDGTKKFPHTRLGDEPEAA
jgi:hypothetical protein